MLSALIDKIGRHEDLTSDEAAEAMAIVMRGEAAPAQIGGLLIGLSMKGERPAELVGLARTMRANAVPFDAPGTTLVDTCGTGGDRSGTFNISTAAALVVAACGVRVAKHGNRSVSSRCGSADVLEALGVDVAATPTVAARALDEAGMAFLFAPTFHPAMRHAAQARRDLGVRTAFNLLGPLTNPAGPTRQIVGVPRPELTELLARALQLLGAERAWVVHGADGLDEISTTGHTKVSECRNGAVHTFYIHPADYGIARASVDALAGGDAAANAAIVRGVLDGQPGPSRDVVLFNAGAVLFVAGHSATVKEGIDAASRAIDEGRARRVLDRLTAVAGWGRSCLMASPATRPDLLEAIVAATRRRVELARAETPFDVLERTAAARAPRGEAFRDALVRADRVNIIAECKRRSPSRGVLRHAYDPVAIASAYTTAGAAAISVLTEPTFFDGSLAHLEAVRAAVHTPLLRKDFIVDEYQLLEARAAGADAVLLIVAALDRTTLRHLHDRAAALGLAALVEVHEVGELDAALDAGAAIVGVNNRNLRTLEVDVRASHEVAARMPPDVVAVSESGLKSAADLEGLYGMGYRAFLIGERFMTAADPGEALAGLIDAGRPKGRPVR